MQTSAMKACFQIAECSFSSAKKMQTSAMKACFQIAECSFSSANIWNISLSCKFLGDLLSILRKFAENKPDNLRKLMGRGDGDG